MLFNIFVGVSLALLVVSPVAARLIPPRLIPTTATIEPRTPEPGCKLYSCI
ncbi:hypothetical protein C8R46DRAFT_1344677 [Mycena filopes]|nr:hypothetical protein C8R46DRAFT_1344677 [Mycena filopes]